MDLFECQQLRQIRGANAPLLYKNIQPQRTQPPTHRVEPTPRREAAEVFQLEELSELNAKPDALFVLQAGSGIIIFQIMHYPVAILFKIDLPDISFTIPRNFQFLVAISYFRVNFMNFITKLCFIIHGKPP